MKLISMSDFALEQYKIDQTHYCFWKIIGKYAEFLKQKINLEMFVSEKSEPSVDCYMQPKEMTRQYDEWFEKYGKGVMFEDFETAINKQGEKTVLGDYTCFKVSNLENMIVEDLVKYAHIKLTKSAVKRIFG